MLGDRRAPCRAGRIECATCHEIARGAVVVVCNRVALVTGGTRGIGRAVTERLADSGGDVAAGYATDCVAAESVRDRCEKAGARVTLHRVDVGDPQSCQRLVDEVLAQHGPPDYPVNNAGTVTEQRYGDIT